MTMFTTSFSGTKDFVNNLNQQSQQVECETNVGTRPASEIDSECLDTLDSQTARCVEGQKYGLPSDVDC